MFLIDSALLLHYDTNGNKGLDLDGLRGLIRMKRLIMNDLIAWKQSKRRKPLVLRGARQVGKSWILEEFGRTFPNGYVKIDFDREPEFAQFFQTTKDVHRILQNLSMATGKAITTDTLIIFDEIQACEEALNSLKYFKEDAPEYYVASAGSLLGLQLSSGFPVGQVDFLEMGPMTFTEFLLADGFGNYVQYLSSINEPEAIPDAFFSPLTEKLKQYFGNLCLPSLRRRIRSSCTVWLSPVLGQENMKMR